MAQANLKVSDQGPLIIPPPKPKFELFLLVATLLLVIATLAFSYMNYVELKDIKKSLPNLNRNVQKF